MGAAVMVTQREERPPADQVLSPPVEGTLLVKYERGFGFIRLDGDEGRDVFVRQVDVPAGCWKLGQRLRFSTLPPLKGNARRAVNVRAAPHQKE